MNDERTLPTKYVACLLDWSEGVDPAFLERCGGKIYLSGFYDDNVNTRICSAVPNVYVIGMGLVAEKMPEDREAYEALAEELMDCWHEVHLNHGENDYYTRASVEAAKAAHPDRFEEIDLEFDDPTDENANENTVRESLCADPIF